MSASAVDRRSEIAGCRSTRSSSGCEALDVAAENGTAGPAELQARLRLLVDATLTITKHRP
jgi:hypothetical protein